MAAEEGFLGAEEGFLEAEEGFEAGEDAGFLAGEEEEGRKELRMTGSIMSYDSMEERVNQYMPF